MANNDDASIKITIEVIKKGFEELQKTLNELKSALSNVGGGANQASGVSALDNSIKQLAGSLEKVTAVQKKGKQVNDEYHKSILEMRGGIGGYIRDVGRMINVQLRWYAAAATLNTIKEALKATTIGYAMVSIDYLSVLEQSTLAIGAALISNGKYYDRMSGKALAASDAFNASMGDATSIIDKLRAANLTTIATLDQLVRAYQETLPIAMKKGFNPDQVISFTTAVVQAAGALGVQLDMLGEETRSLLTGAISTRTSRIAVALGLRPEDIRQHSQNAEQLFSFLMEKLEAFRIAGIKSQTTWKGLLSNIKDIGLYIGGELFKPAFEYLKSALTEVINKIIIFDEKTKTLKINPAFLETITDIQNGFRQIVSLILGAQQAIGLLGAGLSGIKQIIGGGLLGSPDTTEAYVQWIRDAQAAINDMSMSATGWKRVTKEIDDEVAKAAKEGKKAPYDFTTSSLTGPQIVGRSTNQVLRYYKPTGFKSAEFKQDKKKEEEGDREFASRALQALKRQYEAKIREVTDGEQLIKAKQDNAFKRSELSEEEHFNQSLVLTRQSNDARIALLDELWQKSKPYYSRMEKEAGKKTGEETTTEVKKRVDAVKAIRQADEESYTQRRKEMQRKITLDEDNATTERFLREKKKLLALIDVDVDVSSERKAIAKQTADFIAAQEKTILEYRYGKKEISAIDYYSQRKDSILKEVEGKKKAYQSDYDSFVSVGETKKKTGKLTEEELVKYENEKTIRIEKLRKDNLLAEQDGQEQLIQLSQDAADSIALIWEKSGVFGVGNKVLSNLTIEFFDWAKQIELLWKNSVTSLGDTFENVFMDMFDNNLKSAKEYFESFIRSVYSSFAKLISQQSALGLYKGATTLIQYMAGTTTSSGGSIAVEHNGGIIPSFHVGGLMGDERYAKVLTGERVMSRQQSKMFEDMADYMGKEGSSQGVTLNIINQSSQRVKATTSQPRIEMGQLIVDAVLQDYETNGLMRRHMRR